MKGIGKGGLIINLAKTGGNKWREWGDVRQTKNGIRLRLPLSKLGAGRVEIERLASKYRKRIKDQRVTTQFKAHMRDSIEEKMRARAVLRSSTKMESLERAEATRMEVERRADVEEARIAANAARFK